MKAYRRMHSRIKYRMITKDAFKKWNTKASDQLRLCEAGDLPFEALTQWLGNK